MPNRPPLARTVPGRSRRGPDDEQPSAAEAVAQRGAEHQQDREGERIGAHGPFKVLEATAEILADGGQSSGDDQVVECADESGRAGDDHRPYGSAGARPLLLLIHDLCPLPEADGPNGT